MWSYLFVFWCFYSITIESRARSWPVKLIQALLVALAAVHFKAMVLLLLIKCFIVAPIVPWGFLCLGLV